MVNTTQIRNRTGSVSDIHIARCDCGSCDGSGQWPGERIDLSTFLMDCPTCEGLGYLDISSEAQLAYQAYLVDLYDEVVREMPASPPPRQGRKTVAA